MTQAAADPNLGTVTTLKSLSWQPAVLGWTKGHFSFRGPHRLNVGGDGGLASGLPRVLQGQLSRQQLRPQEGTAVHRDQWGSRGWTAPSQSHEQERLTSVTCPKGPPLQLGDSGRTLSGEALQDPPQPQKMKARLGDALATLHPVITITSPASGRLSTLQPVWPLLCLFQCLGPSFRQAPRAMETLQLGSLSEFNLDSKRSRGLGGERLPQGERAQPTQSQLILSTPEASCSSGRACQGARCPSLAQLGCWWQQDHSSPSTRIRVATWPSQSGKGSTWVPWGTQLIGKAAIGVGCAKGHYASAQAGPGGGQSYCRAQIFVPMPILQVG